jgi:hypothetical protein
MFEELRRFSVEGAQMDQMIANSALLKTFITEYTVQGIPVPEWMTNSVSELNREIAARKRDSLMKRVKELKAQQTTLLSAEEKRSLVAAELAAIEGQLEELK